LGISPKRLGGWEPKIYTSFIYDDAGRLVRSIQTQESEFSSEQVDLLLAHEALTNDTGTHGHLLSESTSPEADPNNYEGLFRFTASGPFTDWAEKAKQDAIDVYKKAAGEKANLNGMYWNVRRSDYPPTL
jgi:hypothetical protein